jgi:hypothetical protein
VAWKGVRVSDFPQAKFSKLFRGGPVALPWSAQLNKIEVAIFGAYEAGTGTERFEPVVTGKPTPDCGLVTDITLKARAGICPNRLGERIFLDGVDRHDFIKASPKPVRRQLSMLGLDLRPKPCGHDERPTNVALSCPMLCCQWQLLVPNFAHEFLRTPG